MPVAAARVSPTSASSANPASGGRAPTASTTPGTSGVRPATLPSAIPGQRTGDQRRQGTVYGGPGDPGPGHLTVALPPGHPLENSGSLTGHILSQGWPDAPEVKDNTTKVIVVLLAGLGILVAVGLLVVLGAGDIFGSLFNGMLKR